MADFSVSSGLVGDGQGLALLALSIPSVLLSEVKRSQTEEEEAAGVGWG